MEKQENVFLFPKGAANETPQENSIDGDTVIEIPDVTDVAEEAVSTGGIDAKEVSDTEVETITLGRPGEDEEPANAEWLHRKVA